MLDEETRERYQRMIDEEQEAVYESIKIKPKDELSEREIDVLVDRYVIGNKPSVNIHSKLPTDDTSPPNYSTRIEDAWMVLKLLKEKYGIQADFSTSDFSLKLYKWEEALYPYRVKDVLVRTEDALDFNDMPKVISLAALQAVKK